MTNQYVATALKDIEKKINKMQKMNTDDMTLSQMVEFQAGLKAMKKARDTLFVEQFSGLPCDVCGEYKHACCNGVAAKTV